MQTESANSSPFEHAVHFVLLIISQAEQEEEHPRHIPNVSSENPLLQVMQVVLEVHSKQFFEHLAQFKPLLYVFGGHNVHVSIVFAQVTQELLQGIQIPLARRLPSKQTTQINGVSAEHEAQFGRHITHTEKAVSRAYPIEH